MTKILVTGASGFIGKNVAEHFLKKDYEVYTCASSPTDLPGISNHFSVNSLNANYLPVFKKQEFDFVVHCAGSGSVAYSFEHVEEDYLKNTESSFRLLNAMKQAGSKARVIYLSSAAVYGNPVVLPVSEKSAIEPLSPYGFHKGMAEKICEEFHRMFQLNVKVVRIFSAYGEGLKKQILWDIYTKSKANKTEITLFGSGKETRDFIHVSDVIQAIDLLLNQPGNSFEIYNLASGSETPIEKIAALLLSELNYPGKLIFNGQIKPGDPLRWLSDIDKITSLGFAPQVNLEQGIKKYTQWLKESGF